MGINLHYIFCHKTSNLHTYLVFDPTANNKKLRVVSFKIPAGSVR